MFSAFAAMAILAASTWVRVPPTTSEVFACNKVSPVKQLNPNANFCAMYPNYLARGYQGLLTVRLRLVPNYRNLAVHFDPVLRNSA